MAAMLSPSCKLSSAARRQLDFSSTITCSGRQCASEVPQLASFPAETDAVQPTAHSPYRGHRTHSCTSQVA